MAGRPRNNCQWCGHPPDPRDRTVKGYHIDCAKAAAEFIMDELHSKRGIVYREAYARRWPGRPVPGVPIERPGPDPGR